MLRLILLSCVAFGLAFGENPVKPVDVTILNKEKQISADKNYDVECKVTGSRPDAIITWWKGSRQVNKTAKTVTRQVNDEKQTLSILSFVPVIDDDGKYLTCRAENSAISDAAIEDRWKLNVYYIPVVTLKMGSGLDPDDIEEGDDVYFQCNIRANPKAYRLVWFHNGQELHHNVTSGVILGVHSLVLQGVSRLTAGDFTCLAANTEGNGTSNRVALKVMFVPTCKEEREELYGALKHETVHLKCEVHANPPVVTFQWTFKNSGEQTVVPSARYTSQGTVSRLNYTPVSDMDYGTLSCWGANSVGQMRAPCVYQVVGADIPVVTLKMGSGLDPDDIKEGDDVYFQCNIQANPKPYRLVWFHNGQELHHNVTSGVILGDHSLVLQGVSRLTAGDFTCLAANTEGNGTSNRVALKVMFVPTCKEEREELYGALKHETVHLKCEVDANPPVVTFQWTFKNSGEQTVVPSTRYTSQGTMSRLNYTPVSDMDYGTLSCWGANSVGQMRAPCVYQVVGAGCEQLRDSEGPQRGDGGQPRG